MTPPVTPNGLAVTPSMGWNSWNRYRAAIDAQTILANARALGD